MAGRLAGKVGLISGAARGQGEAEARMFVDEGASVVLGDILLEEQGRVVDALGDRATGVRLDVTREEDWQAAVETALSSYGRLDILVNNAGIFPIEKLEETDLELWNRVIAINQTGVFLGMKYAVPAMRRSGGGSIINISSIAGLIGSGMATAYHGTKGAVRLLTKTTALECAKDNIRVNSIHPGGVDTAMLDVLDPEARQASTQIHPLGRLATVTDIAYGVVYLASDESSFVTGTELVIDGGYTAQ